MIERIKLIGSVGLFLKAEGGSNELRFEPLTLIYGENGRGKTTMTAVLWSLATGDAAYLTERRCLWGDGNQKVIIQGTNDTAIYENGTWTGSVPMIHVFDDDFIEANVATHRTVSLEQRRRLHKVVLGEGNIALTKRVSDLTEEIRELTQTASSAEKVLKPSIIGGMTAATFCSLSPIDNVDAVIASRENDLAAAKAADRIKNAKPLARVRTPRLRLGRIKAVLSKGLTDINAEADARVKSHLASLGVSAEAWVEQGLKFPHDKTCPFCAQPTAQAAVIRDFKAYFSHAYASLKSEITGVLAQLRSTMDGGVLASTIRRIAEEDQKRVFWRAFTPVDETSFPAQRLEEVWAAARDALILLLERKAASPLDPVPMNAETRSAAETYVAVCREVQRACRAVQRSSSEIARIQKDAAKADVLGATSAVERAKNTKTRHTKAISDVCDNYVAAIDSKKTKTTEKEKAVADLAATSQKLLKDYQVAINDYLDKFGAGFRLGGFKKSAEAGEPGCNYFVEVRGHRVDLADHKTLRGAVSSRTALSAGDRSTLALAFFLAKLLQQPSLADEVVVLDDPVSSMDVHRKARTGEYVHKLIAKGAQVVLLSHNAGFLRHVWTSTNGIAMNFIEIAPCATGSELKSWDIANETDTEYHKVWRRLTAYVDDPKDCANDVRASIRFLLEGYLRYHFPAVMAAGNRLGQFIDKTRKARDAGKPITSAERIEELQALNSFSAEKCHLSDSSDAPGPPSVSSVQSYVRQALRFVDPPAP